MKYIIKYITLLFLICNISYAAPRSPREVNNIAKNWLILNEKENHINIEKSNFEIMETSGKTLNYKIIELKPKGWIIVSKDDVAHPVLGYSYQSDIQTLLKDDAFKQWMKSIDAEIELLKDKGVVNDTDTELSEALSVDVLEEDLLIASPAAIQQKGPLIKRKWGIGAPYNNFLPMVYTTRPHLSSESFGWLQIMNYWQWPKRGYGSYSYRMRGTYSHYMRGKRQCANFNTPYNWGHMSHRDKAKISYHVAIANNSEYGIFGVAGKPSPANMRRFFKYNMTNIIKKSSKSAQWWKNKIKANIDRHRPIYYIAETYGHNVYNLDGYKFELNRPSFYHLTTCSGNQGWFTLSANKSSHKWGMRNQRAIFDIHPKTTPKPSNIIFPRNNTMVQGNRNVTLRWNNHGATRKYLLIRANVNGRCQIVYRGNVSGSGKNFKLPRGFIISDVTLYSYKGRRYIGRSGIRLRRMSLPNNITCPRNNARVSGNRNITLRWANRGATRKYLHIRANVNGRYRTIFMGKVSGSSKTFKLPRGFRRAIVSLHSLNGLIYLGSSNINLYPKK